MFVSVFLSLVAGTNVWLLFRWTQRPKRNKSIIYTQPGYFFPIKYWIFRALLLLRKVQNERRLRSGKSSSRNAGYGVKSRNSPEEMDRVQELPRDMQKAVDAVYINGGSSDGVYLVAATARRQNNFVQTILYLRIPDIGLLELPSLPDTWLCDSKSATAFSGGGLTLKPVVPMKSWTIEFDGLMRIAETGEKVEVCFTLLWKAYTNYFDFDTDLHPHTMADAIAREPWTRAFFDTLKSAHQTHYEQFGEITGTVHIQNKPEQDIRVQGVRDHSYGNIRDWKYFHRYALNYAHLEDGSAICVGAICMSIALSRLVVGYFFHPDGTMDAVSYSDFEFFDHGDDGNPPEKFTMKFQAGSKSYTMTCEVLQCPIFYMGKDWDAKIFERFAIYTVNGVRGWGISEWDYRNFTDRKQEKINQ